MARDDRRAAAERTAGERAGGERAGAAGGGRGARRARPKKGWGARDAALAPRASFEELEIHTSDGASLRALVDDPPDGVPLRGTLVLAHAMFARKSSFGRRDRPGLSSALAARGFRTVAFDFRGHGDSAPPRSGGAPGYDDFVRHDLPAVVEYARARGEGLPVLAVGHSLGGHVALAAQGTGRIAVDAVVAVAANLWLPELERSRLRWGVKLALARAASVVSARAGGIPARRLRIGSDDAADRWFRALLGVATRGAWKSADARDDYFAALGEVRVPVAAVLGDRDRINCHPAAGEAFARRCSGPVEVFRAPVGHMGLVTSARGHGAVLAAVAWAIDQARP
ncbi:MAG: alpha/beta fold hydrolase [Labilithrix sp.]|nr:alpha/beta fold hydrolase [Labilithrix sp.]